jgi:MSHA biogenesis protein MshI
VFWRKRDKTIRRTGVFCSSAGLATATVRREPDGKAAVESCVFNESGATDPRAALTRMFDGNANRRGRFSAVLANGSYHLLLTDAPEVADDELRAAIRWKLADLVPFPIADAVVDVFDVPARARRGTSPSVYVIATQKSVVQEHEQIMERFGDRYDVLDAPEMCLRNLAALLPDADQGLAMVHVEQQHAHIVVLRQGTIYLARQVELTAMDREQNTDAVVLELQRSLDYFESHHDQRPVKRTLVSACGDAVSADGLISAIGPRAEALDIVSHLALDPGTEADVTHRNLLALGAALRVDQVAA